MNLAITYRIRDWEEHFENAGSRKLIRLDWVAIPNRMDGSGYCALVDHPNGAAHLGAWVAIIEIASRQKKPRDGTLPDVGGICQCLGRISRLGGGIFQEVLPRLVEIGWIQQVSNDLPRSADTLGDSADTLGDSADTLGKDGSTVHNKTVQDKTEQNPQTPAPKITALARPRRSVHRSIEDIRAALGEERLPWWDAFWAAFPCHEGVNPGIDTYERLVHSRDLAIEIWRGAQAYAARYKADPTMKLKYAQGWLNGERWKDENRITAQPSNHKPSFSESVEKAMRERVALGMDPL
jgi:hypothetical protein